MHFFLFSMNDCSFFGEQGAETTVIGPDESIIGDMHGDNIEKAVEEAVGKR